MANPEHLALLQQGTKVWNSWVQEQPFRFHPDLSGADLHGSRFLGIDLIRADLRSANLSGANLSQALLIDANLTCANLTDADLGSADLQGADLTSANLTRATLLEASLQNANCSLTRFNGANLVRANLTMAKLERSAFDRATLGWTIIVGVNLTSCGGLDSLSHLGPSMIGLDTLYRSDVNIPDVFLRGVGMPDNFITYMSSLVRSPFDFHSCFISFSTQDRPFADTLYRELQTRGVRCWFAPEDVKAGEKLHEQIDQAIHLNDKLLLVLSTNSMNSEWVKTEISKARKKEVREGRRVLFPIRLVDFESLRDWECFDADTGKDSAREIREYFIPDFSRWKDHDSYQASLERLLKDLKAEGTKPDNNGQ